MSEVAACPPSPTADDPLLLPSPTSLAPPVSNSSWLLTCCQPLYASCCTVLLYFSEYCKIENVCFCVYSFLCINAYYLFEKYYNPTTVLYYIADWISWVPRLTLLGL